MKNEQNNIMTKLDFIIQNANDNFDLNAFIWKIIAAYKSEQITKDDVVAYMDQLRVLNQSESIMGA